MTGNNFTSTSNSPYPILVGFSSPPLFPDWIVEEIQKEARKLGISDDDMTTIILARFAKRQIQGVKDVTIF